MSSEFQVRHKSGCTPQKLTTDLKSRNWEVYELYFLCSEKYCVVIKTSRKNCESFYLRESDR